MSSPSRRTRPSSKADHTPGLSNQLILEHVLKYPDVFELPHAKMPVKQHEAQQPRLPEQWTTPRSRKGRQSLEVQPQTPTAAQAATAQFTSSLMNQIGSSPTQPCSLPPIFCTSFLRKCFPPELHLVDFPQALTGLDYLEDLNKRRRREVSNAKHRLNTGNNNVKSDSPWLDLSPGVDKWVRDVENSERKAEALYTQLYILVNELSLLPLNPHNAHAMLNILYPPNCCLSSTTNANAEAPPSASLTPQVLSKQRAAFLSYIGAVESRGTGVLKPLMDQGKRPSDPADETGWGSVADILDKYLRVAMRNIEDSGAVSCRDDLELPKTSPELQSAKKDGKRKPHSGVSVGASGAKSINHSTNASIDTTSEKHIATNQRASTKSNISDKNKPLPSTPAGATIVASSHTSGPVKNFSRLEKIALEIRKIKSKREFTEESEGTRDEGNKENAHAKHSRSASDDVVNGDTEVKDSADRGRPSAMKRLRSLGDIKNYSRGRSKSGSRPATPQATDAMGTQDGAEMFDAWEMQRQRALFEARKAKGAVAL